MNKVALQRKGNILLPYSEEDEKAIKEYSENQIIKANISGVRVPRSYEQLKLYFACCKKVAENTNDPQWQTKEDVDFQCRVQCKIIKSIKVVAGVAYIEVGSIAYDQLTHLQACNYFDRAFDIMAKKLGVKTKDLTAEAKLDMKY